MRHVRRLLFAALRSAASQDAMVLIPMALAVCLAGLRPVSSVGPRLSAVLCSAVLCGFYVVPCAGSALRRRRSHSEKYRRECSCALERKPAKFCKQNSMKLVNRHTSTHRRETKPALHARIAPGSHPRAVPGALCPGRRAAAAPRGCPSRAASSQTQRQSLGTGACSFSDSARNASRKQSQA